MITPTPCIQLPASFWRSSHSLPSTAEVSLDKKNNASVADLKLLFFESNKFVSFLYGTVGIAMYLFYFALSWQNINFINWEYLQECLINDNVNNKTLVSGYVYGTTGSICIMYFFLHFHYLIDFKLNIFDPFRFGNVNIDQISVLKLSLG